MTTTYFYVLPDLATLTALTGIEADQIRYNELTSVYHLGQDIQRVTGYDEDEQPIIETSQGYHINTSAPIAALEAYEVHPSNPITTF